MKRPVLKIIATVFLFFVGLLFTMAMHGFGKAMSGGGVGSRFFLFIVAGPESLCLLIWPLLFPLLPWTKFPNIALTVFCLAVAPIIWVTIVLCGEGVQDDVVRSIWRSAKPVVYIFGTFYLLPSLLGFLFAGKAAIVTMREWRKKE
jgi:hypothetical protein